MTTFRVIFGFTTLKSLSTNSRLTAYAATIIPAPVSQCPFGDLPLTQIGRQSAPSVSGDDARKQRKRVPWLLCEQTGVKISHQLVILPSFAKL